MHLTNPVGNGSKSFRLKTGLMKMNDTPALPVPEASGSPETVYVNRRRVACDGGGSSGHPVVWYSLESGEAECIYCGRRFIYRDEKNTRKT